VGIPSFPAAVQFLCLAGWVALLVYWGLFRSKQHKKQAGFLALLILFGIMLPFIYSLMRSPVALPGRTDFFLYPVWALLLGSILCNLKQSATAVLSLVIAVQCMAITGMDYTRPVAKSEYEVVRYILQRNPEGGHIVCTGLSRPVLEYYLKPHGYQFYSYPRDMARHLAHINEAWYLEHVDLPSEAEQAVNQVKANLSKSESAWVVQSPGEINKPLMKEFNKEGWEISPPIHTAKMGIQKVGTPLRILRVRHEDVSSQP
jgi:hypothetical protein